MRIQRAKTMSLWARESKRSQNPDPSKGGRVGHPEEQRRRKKASTSASWMMCRDGTIQR